MARRPPEPRQREARTVLLRVPQEDWVRLKVGDKVDFRVPEGKYGWKVPAGPLPAPAVAYYQTEDEAYDAFLLVLLSRHREAVFEISEDADAVAREGFPSYDEFRRYWRARRGGVYRPTEMVNVYRTRPWLADTDGQAFGAALLHQLYGTWL